MFFTSVVPNGYFYNCYFCDWSTDAADTKTEKHKYEILKDTLIIIAYLFDSNLRN